MQYLPVRATSEKLHGCSGARALRSLITR